MRRHACASVISSAAAFALALLSATPAAAMTYAVGPGKTYANLGAVAGLLGPGDLVLVDGNATYPSVVLTKSGSVSAPITIRGVRIAGKRPVLSGGNNSIEVMADYVVIEGMEFTGGTSRCFYHHGNMITLRDSVIHDCPKQGLLGADNDSGSLLMEFVEVYKCGGGTQDHQIYMATDESTHRARCFACSTAGCTTATAATA